LVGDIDQASGFSRADTAVLEVMGVPGALDLLKDFARLASRLRLRIRELVREFALTAE
jgi:hypothetical protein